MFSASMAERDSDPRRMRPAACPYYNSTSCWGRGLFYQEQSWKKRNVGTQPELDQEASNETQAMSDSAATYQHNKQVAASSQEKRTKHIFWKSNKFRNIYGLLSVQNRKSIH